MLDWHPCQICYPLEIKLLLLSLLLLIFSVTSLPRAHTGQCFSRLAGSYIGKIKRD